MRSAVQSCDPLLLKLTKNQALAEKSQVLFSYVAVCVGVVTVWLWQGCSRIHVSRYVSKILMLTTFVEAICLNYRPKKDNTYPLMLRLTKSGKRKYVSLGLSVEERFWDFKKNTPKRNCPDRDAILSVIERRSKQYREQITQFKVEGKDYTLETLVQRVENPVRQMNFGEYLDYFIQQLKEENRLGYAERKRTLSA